MIGIKAHVADGARIAGKDAYLALVERVRTDPDTYWRACAKRLDWTREPERVFHGDMQRGEFSWFEGGQLNVAANCLDRHLADRGEQTAITWVRDEAGEYETLTYAQLHAEVCRAANALRKMGVTKGDRVCIYLPMVPHLAITMLACARIGAVHSVVFAGFSAEALRDRIVDAGCKLVVTADEGLRGGRRIPLKATTDAALAGISADDASVEAVLLVRRTGADVNVVEGRDRWWDDALGPEATTCPIETMDAEDPLFILYTSGSTGRPKGLLHTTGGYLTWASWTCAHVFDLREGDVYFCAADIGWVTGHSYIVYGPLANGAHTVMFESTPLYPDASRYWRVIEDLGVTVFYTAPTAIRAIARAGDAAVRKHERSSLRILGTVGEPINPEVWTWYHDVCGEGRCAVVDTWWQTETGGIMITPLPGATACKPGSATLPLPGVEPVLLDEQAQVLEGNDVRGILCLSKPWPGQARTIWGDHERFVNTYYAPFPGYYFTGDGAWRDEDGYYWITGRVDDVLNVSGHRLGTAEIESALVAHDDVAEAAVVGMPHEIKGTGICAYVIANSDAELEGLRDALRLRVREGIGPIATPDRILVVPGLPKTRSGKIMRRILRKIAAGEADQLGDVSTLADPGVVDALIAAFAASD